MPKLRRLSGRDAIRIVRRFGFEEIARRGSHAKLRRLAASGEKETLTIPTHRNLDVGALQAIFRQASRYIDEDDLRPHFYSE